MWADADMHNISIIHRLINISMKYLNNERTRFLRFHEMIMMSYIDELCIFFGTNWTEFNTQKLFSVSVFLPCSHWFPVPFTIDIRDTRELDDPDMCPNPNKNNWLCSSNNARSLKMLSLLISSICKESRKERKKERKRKKTNRQTKTKQNNIMVITRIVLF